MRILTEHHVKEPTVFFPALGRALVKKPPKIRLRERIFSEDRERIFLTWSVRSRDAIEDFITEHIPAEAHRFEIIVILDPILFPMITSLFPFSVVQPKGGVIVQGIAFGAQAGKFLLRGAFPGGALELVDLQWGESFAAGVIPWITGVQDQDAFLQIVTKEGRTSNLFPVRFTAAREVRLLQGDALTPVRCGDEGGSDSCYIGGAADPFTVAGFHFAVIWPGSASGQDVYQCTLANGWVFDHYEWNAQNGIQGGPFGQAPDPDGQSAFTVDISWFYDVFGSSNYELSIFVVGPFGVPYQ